MPDNFRLGPNIIYSCAEGNAYVGIMTNTHVPIPVILTNEEPGLLPSLLYSLT